LQLLRSTHQHTNSQHPNSQEISTMTIHRPQPNRRAFSLWIAGLPLLALTGTARAQGFPGKPIRIVVPFNAGGPVDIIARSMGARLSPLLGQPVVVDNKGGASTIIGTDNVVKSPPDGYSLLLVGSGARSILPAITKLPYEPEKDLRPVSLVVASPQIFVASPQMAAKGVTTLKALTAYALANPGKLNAGSVGAGTITSLVGELYKREQSLQIVNVPFRGGAPAVQALMAGEIDIMTADVAAVIPQIQAKKLIGLAVTSAKRVKELPDVQSVVEAGYPSLIAVNAYCLFAPAQTPRDVVNTLQKAVASALAAPELRSQFEKSGMQAVGSTPQELEKLLQEQTAKWTPLARALGVRLD
jgi:tripartite-type tricarboxylate transporter receptor subunit TctC